MKTSSSEPNEAECALDGGSLDDLIDRGEEVGLRERLTYTRTFALLPNDFTVEAGELTPTMKIRRSAIADRYAGTIADLYSPPRNGDAEHLHDAQPVEKADS